MHKARIGVDTKPPLLDVAECIPTEREHEVTFTAHETTEKPLQTDNETVPQFP